jgi:sphinganine-1-phosphate aldolase
MKWQGGFYATPSMAGSRPGSIIAGTWAALCKIGQAKYIEYTRDILSAASNIRKAIKEEIPEIKLGTEHNSPVVSIVNIDQENCINCIALADVLLKHHGWGLSKTQNPQGAHVALTLATCYDWKAFVSALKSSVQMMKDMPELNHSSSVATYGMAGSMPDPCVLDQMCALHTNALLDALP